MLGLVIAFVLFLSNLEANTASSKLCCDCICPSPSSIDSAEKLKQLEASVLSEFRMLNIPAQPWILPQDNAEEDVLDVAIIGGGMAGISAAIALIKEGISNIKIFDENSPEEEGPWVRYARMNVLRSGKTCLGPSMGIPSLTFWAWYEAQYGPESWNQLKTAPTRMWNDYIKWVRAIMKFPQENSTALVKINPTGPFFQLIFHKKEVESIVNARKIILATGRAGAGGLEIPQFMKAVPRQFYAHSGERINTQSVKGKSIAIIGAGASAFDAAGMALENGAKTVEMLVRRPAIPQINKFTQFYHPGMVHGFYYLPDEVHCSFLAEALECGTPPPKDALERIKGFDNLQVHYQVDISNVTVLGDAAVVHSSSGDCTVDFIILATGFRMDLSQCREVSAIFNDIALWRDKVSQSILKPTGLGRFPYLGPHFEFQEKDNGAATYLKDIHCFNYGAFLSHGMLSGDIALISHGATKLAQGIVADFFIQNIEGYLEKYRSYQAPLFRTSEYQFLH